MANLKYAEFRREEALGAEVSAVLANKGICFVSGFPIDGDKLVKFASLFGRVMERRGSNFTDFSRFVGDVRLKEDIPEKDRLPTQTSEGLPLHTARSYEAVRPKYFLLLKARHGFVGPPGKNGESLFLNWNDLFNEYAATYPPHASIDIGLLSTVRVSYQPPWLRDAPTVEPILLLAGPDHHMRYWEGFRGNYNLDPSAEAVREQYDSAVERLDRLIGAAKGRIVRNLGEGELALLDNRLVAHGRQGFISRTTIDGKTETSRRQVYTCHVQ